MLNGNQTGSYSNLNFTNTSGSRFNIGQKVGFENILFPFVCRITFLLPNTFNTSRSEVEFEIEIIEPGSWEIVINN